MGTPLHATADGVIVVAGSDDERAYGLFRDFYGLLVIERLDRTYRGNPVYVLFGHLSRVEVKVGERVSAGDVVGRVGASGIAMGPHLHLEVRVGQDSYGATRNPEFWLQLLPGRGTLVGRLLTPDGRSWPGATLYVRRASTPHKIFQTLYTYVDDPRINPDEEWGENFLWADAPAGDYLLETPWGKMVPFSVEAGGTSFLEVRDAPGSDLSGPQGQDSPRYSKGPWLTSSSSMGEKSFCTFSTSFSFRSPITRSPGRRTTSP